MVIRFFCICGQKIPIADDQRDMVGHCPSCGDEVCLKNADPSRIERDPQLVVKLDKTDPGSETEQIRERNVPVEKQSTDELPFAMPVRDSALRKAGEHIDDEGDTDEVGEAPARVETWKSEPGTDEIDTSSAGGGRPGTEDLHSAHGAKLVLKGKGDQEEVFKFNGTIIVGKSKEADIQLHGKGVSRMHCRILWENGKYVIEDMGSKNGVRINRQKIQNAPLTKGDYIELGTVGLYYVD